MTLAITIWECLLQLIKHKNPVTLLKFNFQNQHQTPKSCFHHCTKLQFSKVNEDLESSVLYFLSCIIFIDFQAEGKIALFWNL